MGRKVITQEEVITDPMYHARWFLEQALVTQAFLMGLPINKTITERRDLATGDFIYEWQDQGGE